MAVAVYIPAALRIYCDGAAQLSTSAATVADALAELREDYPQIYQAVCDETGSVRRHMNLFVNSLHVREREGLDTALESGDTLTIFPAVSGG